jgi:glyoxylase-like metal-dependent hydrolase (beta-lactamase superfamily II)
MQLAPSLHRIGSDIVACHLVEGEGGLTLIDAGLPGLWGELQAELRSMGRSLEDIRGVVLTHGDTDHVGFAERLRREQGVSVFIHEADAARARGEIKKSNSGWGKVKWGPLLRFLLYSARRGGLRIPALTEVQTISGDVTLDLPGAPQVIHIPGHTPGSVAVWVPSVEALFVGDALTTANVLTGDEGPGPAPFTLDPAAALASLARLEEIPARWLVPGHGAPWQGSLREALATVRQKSATA